MIILGIHSGFHDAAAALFDDYRLVAAVSLERLTRRKGDGRGVPTECIEEVLEIAGLRRRDVDTIASTRGALPWRYFSHFRGGRLIEGKLRQLLGREKLKDMTIELRRAGEIQAERIFNAALFNADHEFRADTAIGFANHHFAHALPSLFFTDWEDALLYTADGGGDNVHYSHRVFRDGALQSLFGDDRWLLPEKRIDSLGLAYGYATQALGYRINRHEGKLTGLAALGEPTLYDEIARRFRLDADGRIDSDFESYLAMRGFIFALAKDRAPADVAASIQKVLEDFIFAAITRLLDRHPVRHLGLSGGVFANVRLNRLLAEQTSADEVFIFPAMSDEGLAVGAALQHLLERDGLSKWLTHRGRLNDVYCGRDFGEGIDRALSSAPGVRKVSDSPVPTTVDLLAQGRIVAIFAGRMEYGPRALGARSILASPVERSINDSLNLRLKRTEFMPFAPVVRDVDAEHVFDIGRVNRYACRFMTITCAVRQEWRGRIPAVVHVDGTARPQVAERGGNSLYYDIIGGFAGRTGIPVLVNTSFNVHEEPIVNRPEECVRALLDDRIDFVVTERGVYGARMA
ncbi:MAG: hypothetical protein EXQ89_02860 [Rhodospirillaceae bacterium]|nr:hypothetical protein [Rhodospirillaceae bacterium]